MLRREFIGMAAVAMMGSKMDLNELDKLFSDGMKSDPMPVLFVGHGSPMNAIEDNRYSQTWEKIGKQLPTPKAILSVSAHWLTKGTKVTAMEKPKTIHDFGGFPQPLFDVEYPAQGSPEIAKSTQAAITRKHVLLDDEWGLDHGTWSVLNKMYPKADIPTLQLSLDYAMPPEDHYALATELKKLRNKGVLILGSGNVVHNLRALSFEGKSFDWAIEFDSFVEKAMSSGDDKSIVDFQNLGALAQKAHPTYEHFLPLLYTLGVKNSSDKLTYFNEGVDLGSISMRSAIYAA